MVKRTITLENGTEVKLSQESYDALAKAVDAKKEDFSEFVGSAGCYVRILGKTTHVLCTGDKRIIFSKDLWRIDTPVTYDVVEAHELKFGDIFINDDISPAECSLYDVLIAVGKDEDGDVRYQYINDCGIEFLSSDYICETTLVKRFRLA